jgi:hypothetical protein
MIPDGWRGNAVFNCMFLNSALRLLVRSSSTALLMLTDAKYVRERQRRGGRAGRGVLGRRSEPVARATRKGAGVLGRLAF